MKSRSRLILPALRELGIGATFQYAKYQVALRSGMLRRRTPSYRWDDKPLGAWLMHPATIETALTHRGPFFFDSRAISQETLKPFQSSDLLREADEITNGAFRLFGGPPITMGHEPNWGEVPLVETSQVVSLDGHWTEYQTEGDLDLRLLWEPSRFGWAFALCRAYGATGEERYAEALSSLLASWMEANQPNRGPHWISGQEAAIRILALCFAWHTLAPFLERLPDVASNLLTMVATHAARIPPTLSYAKAQRNNHLVTEAVGLYTAGSQFPFFEHSDTWRRVGRGELIQALEDQVFADGGYIQYSTNYQRLALSAGLWAALLAEANGEALPEKTLGALRRMTEFLLTLTDPQTGGVPNWGHNDGSNILPLSGVPHPDYRPLLQAASRALLGGPAFDPGPWDEMSLWLGLPLGGSPISPKSAHTDFPDAGIYLIKGASSRATLHCAQFSARPAHSDQLHLDLWWKRNYISRDVGTYRYTAPSSVGAGAMAHNSLLADRKEPMDRAGRFLWLNWSDARFFGRWQAEDGSVCALAAEHELRDAVTHRRSLVHAGESLWVVMDELLGSGRPGGRNHSARIAWSLIDWPWEFEGQRLILESSQGPLQLRLTPSVDTIALYRAGERLAGDLQTEEEESALGWWFPTYGYKEPALSLVATIDGPLPLRLTSWWRMGDVTPEDLVFETNSLADDPLIAFLSNE